MQFRSGMVQREGVMAMGGHDLPSTVTWQEHSAWPAPFLATHLYKPLSSGSAFSMETEQREPGEEEGELLSAPSMGPLPALEPGAQQAEPCGNQPHPHESQGTFC